jgi:D-alanyl-D-alanine carboxypeptidase
MAIANRGAARRNVCLSESIQPVSASRLPGEDGSVSDIVLTTMTLGRSAWTVLMVATMAVRPGAGQPAIPRLPEGVSLSLQRSLDRWAASPTHVGVSAAVLAADGAQWVGASGSAGQGEPMRTDHLIQVGSITKTMTAAAVLQLVDEGVLRLEDPIARWLPPRKNIEPSITIRQLLNHTSGLANYTESAALGTAIDADPNHLFTPDELLGFVGEPRFAPGAATDYTNTAFIVLGQIVERAGERAMGDLYRRLFQPLGLQVVFMPGVEEAPGPVAWAFGSSGMTNPMARPSVLSIGHSAFGFMANAETIARWGHALFSGAVISDSMQRELRTLIPAAGSIRGETGVGLGIRSYEYLGRTQIGHSGGAAFGSSLLLFDLETGVTVAVLMNQGQGADHFLLAPQLLELATRRIQ